MHTGFKLRGEDAVTDQHNSVVPPTSATRRSFADHTQSNPLAIRKLLPERVSTHLQRHRRFHPRQNRTPVQSY